MSIQGVRDSSPAEEQASFLANATQETLKEETSKEKDEILVPPNNSTVHESEISQGIKIEDPVVSEIENNKKEDSLEHDPPKYVQEDFSSDLEEKMDSAINDKEAITLSEEQFDDLRIQYRSEKELLNLIDQLEALKLSNDHLRELISAAYEDILSNRQNRKQLIDPVIEKYEALISNEISALESYNKEHLRILPDMFRDVYDESMNSIKKTEYAYINELKKGIDEGLKYISTQHEEIISEYKDIENYKLSLKPYYQQDHLNQQINEVTLAFLKLQDRIRENPSNPFDKQYYEFMEKAKVHPTIERSLSSLPFSLSESGISSLRTLKHDFQSLKNDCLKSHIRNESENLYVYSTSYLKAFVFPGDKTFENIKGMEAISKAEFYLERNQLDQCLAELSKLDGNAKAIMGKWVDEVQKRVVIEHALSLFSTELIKLQNLQINQQ